MCGIVGIASNNNCIPELLSGLQTLEYRGYDSSGIACNFNNQLIYQKSKGKISKLIDKLNKEVIQGNTAIAHTRWATHGKPSLINAHPFVKDNCALVHNGIIENFEDLVKAYSVNKDNVQSETDTEVIAEIYNGLLHKFNSPIEALISIIKKVEGTFAFAFLVKGTTSIYAARKGSPLVVGLSKKYNALSSDVLGLPDQVRELVFLEENDIVEITNSSFSVFNLQGNKVEREIHSHMRKK